MKYSLDNCEGIPGSCLNVKYRANLNFQLLRTLLASDLDLKFSHLALSNKTKSVFILVGWEKSTRCAIRRWPTLTGLGSWLPCSSKKGLVQELLLILLIQCNADLLKCLVHDLTNSNQFSQQYSSTFGLRNSSFLALWWEFWGFSGSFECDNWDYSSVTVAARWKPRSARKPALADVENSAQKRCSLVLAFCKMITASGPRTST